MTAPYALSVRDAAAYLSISEDTVRQAIYTGRLTARKVGARWSIKRHDLERWHDAHPLPDEVPDQPTKPTKTTAA